MTHERSVYLEIDQLCRIGREASQVNLGLDKFAKYEKDPCCLASIVISHSQVLVHA